MAYDFGWPVWKIVGFTPRLCIADERPRVDSRIRGFSRPILTAPANLFFCHCFGSRQRGFEVSFVELVRLVLKKVNYERTSDSLKK